MAFHLTKRMSDLKVEKPLPRAIQQNALEAAEYGITNSFKITPKAKCIAYRYEVDVMDLVKNKSLTAGAGDDGKKALLRKICFELVNRAFRHTQHFGTGGKAKMIYDGRKTMFLDKTIQMPMKMMFPNASQHLRGNAELELKPHPQHFELRYQQRGPVMDTFVELLTSQHFIAIGHLLVNNQRMFGEPANVNPLVETRRGLKKSAKNTESGLAINLDVQNVAFFSEGNLQDIVLRLLRLFGIGRGQEAQLAEFWPDLSKMIAKTSALLSYDATRVIVIDHVSTRKCRQIKFEIDGQVMSMVEFYRTRKNLNIDGDLPAICQQSDPPAYFPMSCLQLLPGQRVAKDKFAINDVMQNILVHLNRMNSMEPQSRYLANGTICRAIIGGGWLQQWHVEMEAEPLGTRLGVLKSMPFHFGRDGRNEIWPHNGVYRFPTNTQFKTPSRCLGNWAVGHPSSITEGQIRPFIDRIDILGTVRGMSLPKPPFVVIEHNNLAQEMEKLKHLKFLLYIDSAATKSHGLLKLCERNTRTLTQHVTIEKIKHAGDPLIQNILNKMNLKLFGVNFDPSTPILNERPFKIRAGGTLIVAIHTIKPPRATPFEAFQLHKAGAADLQSTEPMVVGWCGNYMSDPTNFVGDYFFQPNRKNGTSDMLADKMAWTLGQTKKNRKGLPPDVVMILRSGVTESQLTTELNVIKAACSSFAPNWAPKFIYCIVDKVHDHRFYRYEDQAAAKSNPSARTVVDVGIVTQGQHEFFLQANVPKMGTSKVPRFRFLETIQNMGNGLLCGVLNELAMLWQLSNMVPSLPAPTGQAKELAKRGHNNYVQLREQHAVPCFEGTRYIDLAALNARLCYGDHLTGGTRFTA